jgi:predicted DsbA family dithiol-disulfide isomerase
MNEKILEKFDDKNAFIKVTEPSPVEGADKAFLNRKGNQKFNEGDIESAKRIFMTTGYSDGLSRTGDYYSSKYRPLEALRMYWMAHDHKKAQPLIEKLSFVLQDLMHEDDDIPEKDVILQEEQDVKND